jgi:hypothetical protein
VLANVAKAIILCRNNERLNQALANDRDDARAELGVALAQSERERAFLDSLYEAIPDLVWVKDPEGSIYPAIRRFPVFTMRLNTTLLGVRTTILSTGTWRISSVPMIVRRRQPVGQRSTRNG